MQGLVSYFADNKTSVTRLFGVVKTTCTSSQLNVSNTSDNLTLALLDLDDISLCVDTRQAAVYRKRPVCKKISKKLAWD